MRLRTIALVLGGCLFAVVVALVVVAIVGGGGAVWLLIGGSGPLRRAAAGADIDGALRVTAASPTRVVASSPARPDRRVVTYRLRYENLGDRDVAGFTGTVLFADDKGWTVFSCDVGEGRPLGAHETADEERELECFAYAPSSGTLDTVDVERLSPSWLANSLLFADGTKIEVLPEPR